jgi:peptide/nickel transport system permease protein
LLQVISRRLVFGFISVVAASMVVFVLTRLSGDPAVLMMPVDATIMEIDAFRERMGWNDPWLVQYGRFVWGALQGDFGTSLRHAQPAFAMVMDHMPATLQLAFTAMVIAIIVAVPLGIITAARRGTWVDGVGQLFTTFGQSVPNFWLAIMLIAILAVEYRLLPVAGRGTPLHLVLPSLTIAVGVIAIVMRLTRTSMLEVVSEDYIRTARGKGLPEWRILIKHAARNVMIPIVTIIGLRFGYILGSAVVVETVFAWPGVGYFTLQAIRNADYPIVQASVFVLAVCIIAINLIVDLLYAALDPRIRMEL